jgi:ribokinase
MPQIYMFASAHVCTYTWMQVVDTVGAGDAFLGALASYIASGMDVADAMALANEVATITVTAEGAQSSYLTTVSDLPERLRLPSGA